MFASFVSVKKKIQIHLTVNSNYHSDAVPSLTSTKINRFLQPPMYTLAICPSFSHFSLENLAFSCAYPVINGRNILLQHSCPHAWHFPTTIRAPLNRNLKLYSISDAPLTLYKSRKVVKGIV